MFDDGWSLYGPNFTVTASGALQGLPLGKPAGDHARRACRPHSADRGLATQLAILSYCTPLLALGPIILVVFGGRTPTIFLAAMYCFFTTMVGTLAGLRSADKSEPRPGRRVRRWALAEVHQSTTGERTSEYLCRPQDCCTLGRTRCDPR